MKRVNEQSDKMEEFLRLFESQDGQSDDEKKDDDGTACEEACGDDWNESNESDCASDSGDERNCKHCEYQYEVCLRRRRKARRTESDYEDDDEDNSEQEEAVLNEEEELLKEKEQERLKEERKKRQKALVESLWRASQVQKFRMLQRVRWSNPTPENGTSIQDLPDLALERILHFVTLRDLGSLARVCINCWHPLFL